MNILLCPCKYNPHAAAAGMYPSGTLPDTKFMVDGDTLTIDDVYTLTIPADDGEARVIITESEGRVIEARRTDGLVYVTVLALFSASPPAMADGQYHEVTA